MARQVLSFLSGSAARRSPKRRRFSSHPFYLVLVTLLLLSTVAWLAASFVSSKRSLTTLTRRDALADLDGAEQECRLVYKAKDQCAFIKANCADHEIGLLSYLRLYYCNLANAKPIAFVILALWLALLFSTIGIAASDFLCINLSTIASILGMSESLTGVTFLAFGNGSPDVFSTFAAMSSNSGSLAVGELLGAAGFITAVVAGSMALVRPFRVARRSFVRDIIFFIAAASVSLVFLADGRLHAWECLTMISFYICYVITVVSWHWFLGRQRRQRERDLAARAHFHIPENQELEIEEEPEDDDHPVTAGSGGGDGGPTRPLLLLGASTEDFSALERAGTPSWKVENVEEDEEARDRYLAELQGNMRVSRAPPGQRGYNRAPIRPSLVGALEFRSVLASLQRSRNFRTGQIVLRRYTDEPTGDGQQGDGVHDRSHRHHPAARARPISAYEEPVHQRSASHGAPSGHGPGHQSAPQPGLLFASPTSSGYPSRSQSPAVPERSKSPSLLAPPEDSFRSPNYHQGAQDRSRDRVMSAVSPRDTGGRPSSPGSMSSIAPFPLYHDATAPPQPSMPHIQLPPSATLGGSIRSQDLIDVRPFEPRPWRWWPYRFLPPPHVLSAALFPTLSGWVDGTVWDRFLAVAAAPSVFVLTITLPVVEPAEAAEPESSAAAERSSPLLQPTEYRDCPSPDGGAALEPYRDADGVFPSVEPPEVAVNGETRQHLLSDISTANRRRHDSEAPLVPTTSAESKPSAPKVWNRWLLATQLVTAPLFISWAAWTNLDSSMTYRNLLLFWLVSLVISALLLTALFLTTTSSTTQLPSRARPLLAFLGFVVAIAWISILATEVVNLLKTLGVILSISDSLLGLTVFAIGNSLGDLVADITVARLGYPVMALSACFGGPMLNILMGIGVGGLYMTLHGAGGVAPDASSTGMISRAVSHSLTARSDTFHIHVSRSLLISGVALLVTLVGLLVVVPLNGWRMDRKVGVGLVILWCVSTVVNVIVELVS
ncbi:hypothetical protein VTO42DRAFT_4444 [Malbranchea cinnamomea]